MPLYLKDALSDRTIPLYPDVQGRLRFAEHGHEGTPPVCVISIPKSGTYQIGAMLGHLGLIDCEVHVSERSMQDYRGLPLENKWADHHSLTVHFPLCISAGCVGDGQFIVGHLCHDRLTEKELAPFCKVFAYRNLKDVLVSYMRFIEKREAAALAGQGWVGLPDGPEKLQRYLQAAGEDFLARIRPMLGWLDRADCLRLRFETLNGDEGQAAQNALVQHLAAHVQAPIACTPEALIALTMATPTLTKSAMRSDWTRFWDERTERWFKDSGGLLMNKRLGYD
jgi:hypothetical protein